MSLPLSFCSFSKSDSDLLLTSSLGDWCGWVTTVTRLALKSVIRLPRRSGVGLGSGALAPAQAVRIWGTGNKVCPDWQVTIPFFHAKVLLAKNRPNAIVFIQPT